MLGFRVWGAVEKKMYLWPTVWANFKLSQGGNLIMPDGIEVFENSKYFYEYIPMQSTGLKDIHHKEIYIHDIVSWPEFYINEYRDGIYLVENTMHFIDVFSRLEHLGPDDLIQVKIIGNIYENPELLEKIRC